ncbi:MAG: polysulfide reductase NrfD [Caldilineales bacterium]|nr:polysulfide reductase NrfD [Caldilineales bacterium]MCW5857677.1 polysulfide reductase NrfD [Caldilineales bacterium]
MTAHAPTLRRLFPTVFVGRDLIVIGVLGFLITLGVLAGLARLWLGLGATTSLNDTYSWGIWIGFDFLLIALSGAGFTMAAVGHVLHLHRFHAAVRPAILAGLMGYVAVLLLLVLDLGRPDRFYHFLIYFNIHSPLFEISWCVLLYSTVLALEVSPYLFERLGWKRPVNLFYKLITPITIIGVTLSSLHQSTLGTLYLNMPHRLDALWYTPWLPVQFFVSSILAGLSVGTLAYIVGAGVARKHEDPGIARGLGKGIVGVGLVYLGLKFGDLILAGEWPRLLAMDKLSLLWWAEIGLGVILPLLLLTLPGLRSRPETRWLAPVLVIFGLGMNRFDATLFAQHPLNAALYTPHLLEWFSTAGILAAAALAWWLGVRVLAVFEK